MKKTFLIVFLLFVIAGLTAYIFIPFNSIQLPWNSNPLKGTVWSCNSEALGISVNRRLEFSADGTVIFINDFQNTRAEGKYSATCSTVVFSWRPQDSITYSSATFSENSMSVKYIGTEIDFTRRPATYQTEKTRIFIKEK